MHKIKNAFSVDVEDWYHGMLHINNKDWPSYQGRLTDSLQRVLDILSANQAKATFFILGYAAEKNPLIVEAIARAGHEIAVHGYGHRPVYELSPDEFKEDVKRSKEILELISKTRVIGYRAPFFSITKKSLWALDILHDLGFEYDSSVFPTKNFMYGIPDAPHTIYKAGDKGILEFPMSVNRFFGVNIPACGGFYLRALPYFVTEYGIRRFNSKGYPAIVYMHPWELDVHKPKVRLPLRWKIVHEYNIASMEKKIRRLTKVFEFTTIKEVLFGTQG